MPFLFPVSFKIDPFMIPLFPMSHYPCLMRARRFFPASRLPYIHVTFRMPTIITRHPDMIRGRCNFDRFSSGRGRSDIDSQPDVQLCFCRNGNDQGSSDEHNSNNCFHIYFLYIGLQRAEPNCSRFVDCVSISCSTHCIY